MMLLEKPRIDLSSRAQGGEPSSLSDVWSSTDDSERLGHSSIARAVAVDRAYDDRIEQIEKATGEKLSHPLDVADPRDLYYPPAVNMQPVDDGNSPVGLGVQDIKPRYDPAATFKKQLDDVAEKFPEQRGVIGPDRPILEDAKALTRAADKRAAEVWENSDKGALAWAARLGGGFYASLHDPVNIGTLALGGGPAGAGIKGLAWMALKQGAANAGAEAAIQPFVQSWRKEAGLDYGLSQAALDIGMAGLFGAGLDAGVRGAVRIGRNAVGRPYLGPDPISPVDALGRAARVAPEGSLLRKASEGDADALRQVAKESGLESDPTVKHAIDEVETQSLFPAPERVDDGEHLANLAKAIREESGAAELPAGDAIAPALTREVARLADEVEGVSHTIEGKAVGFRAIDPREVVTDATQFQFKSGGDLAGVTDRLRGVDRWDPISAGKAIVFERADGQMVIADGHQRLGLAQRLASGGQDAKLDAYIFREADGWTPEDVRAYAALKNMRESSGTSVDMAQVMRERPDLIDGSLPLSDAKLREATMLSRLSPTAFDAVVGGRLPPQFAALIGESVRDAGRHAGLLDELADANLQTIQQARLYLKQLMELPTTTETQMTLFGEESFTRTVLLERTKVLDSALRSLRTDKRIFSLLDKQAGTIEGAGNVLARDANAAKSENAAQLAELIEKLATSRGTVAVILNDAAASVARGYSPTLASRAFVARIGDILERDGINGLVRDVERVEPELSPRPMEEPNGPEALAQTEELEAQIDAEQQSLFALPRDAGKMSPSQGGEPVFDLDNPGGGSRVTKVGNTEVTYGVGRSGIVEVILVKTPKAQRGEGSARAALQTLIAEADAKGLRVGLNADPMDAGVTKPKLEAFYKSLGFKPNKGRTRDFSTQLEFLREPQAPKRGSLSLGGEKLSIASLRNATLSVKATEQMATIRSEIDKAVSRSLPVGWRADVRQRLVFGDLPDSLRKRNPGVPPSLEIEGTFDPYERIIYVSMAALDPVERAYEEAGHALKSSGLIPEADYGILRAKATEINARGRFKIDERYGDVYGARWKDDPSRLESALEEEAIMQMVAARASGDDFGKASNTILDKLVKFFKAIRDMMGLKGFRDFEDVFQSMTEGGFARSADDGGAMPIGGEVMAANAGPGVMSTAFRHWFGKSTVVDDGGRPLTVYKGMPMSRWEDGAPIEVIDSVNGPWAGFFTDNRDAASGFADAFGMLTRNGGEPAGVVLAHLRIERPYIIDGGGRPAREFMFDHPFRKDKDHPGARAALLDDAYDGIVIRNTADEGTIYVPKLPTQIKSIFNRGTYDPNEPNIMFATKAETAKEILFSVGGKKEAAKAPKGETADGEKVKSPKVSNAQTSKRIRDLINASAAEGKLPREDADDLLKRFGELEKQHKDPVKAKAQLSTEIDAEAARKRRLKALTDIARLRNEKVLTAFRDARGQPDPAKAMIAILENLAQHELPEGTMSVVGQKNAIMGMAIVKLDAMLHEFRDVTLDAQGVKTAITGQVKNKARLKNVVRELFKESTGDKSAAEFAKAATGVMEDLRERFNAAGGSIGKRDDFGLPQFHDPAAMVRAGKDAWMKYITPLLDAKRMKHPLTGHPMLAGDVEKSLSWIYDNIVSDGWIEREPSMAFRGLGSIANQKGEHRFLIFKDADSWMKYSEAYGNGSDALAVLISHVRGMAADIAAMEVFGPNPRAMITYLQQFVMKQAKLREAGKPALFPAVTEFTGQELRADGKWQASANPLKWLPRRPEVYADKMNGRMDDMWDIYRGGVGAKVGNRLAESMQTLRNFNVSSMLGGAAVSALTDPFWQVAARKFAGLPVTKTISHVIREIAPGGEREARRAGIIADTYLHMHNEQAREAAAWSATKVTGYLADRVLSLSMLNMITRAGNHAMAMGIQGFFADQTAKGFTELSGPLQRLLRRHGLGEADWDQIRLDASGNPAEGDFLTPPMIYDAIKARKGDTTIAERYLAMALTEAQYATATGTLRARAMSGGAVKAGTPVGEGVRLFMQFKGFAVNIAILQIERVIREFISQGFSKGAQYGTAALISATLGGALVIQLKQLLAGKDPRPMTDENGVPDAAFWGAAAYQSGGLSIWGDLLTASENRIGGGIASTLTGPSVATIEDVINLTYGSAKKSLFMNADQKTNFGRESAKAVRRYVPGSSIWYIRQAWNRVLMDNLQRMLDPDAEAAFRRQIGRAKKDYRTDFWWAPGKSAPSRAPNLGSAIPALAN